MIIERDENECAPLPPYFAIDADGNIVGTSYQGAVLMNDEISRVNYIQALKNQCIACISQPKPQQSTERRLVDYNEIREEVQSLLDSPPADEFGPVRPSPDAVMRSQEIILRMISSMADFPRPVDVSSDRDGSIRCLWENGARTLELVCSSEPNVRPYIYFSDQNRYRIAHDMSAPRLSRLVGWLNGSIPEFPR